MVKREGPPEIISEGGVPPELTRREISERTLRVLTKYGETSLERLRPMVRSGAGKEEMGVVRYRPGEVQHGIDLMGEGLLASIVREEGLPATIIGENNTNTPIDGVKPVVYLPVDPLDNTSPYVRGLDTPPYSVVGAFDVNGNSVGGVIVDIGGNKIYRATGRKVTVKDAETGIIKDLSRSQRTDITDEKITIASFVGENEYSLPFFDNFRPLIEAMHRKGMLYPGGGAFIYALLASGALDAYVMLNEPRSEIDPGLPFLLASGGKADSIDPETGKIVPYRFDPNKSASESVPLFIASSQPQIRDSITELYLKGKEEKEMQERARAFYDEHLLRANQDYDIPQTPLSN